MTESTWRGQSAVVELDGVSVGGSQSFDVSFGQDLTKARGGGDDVSVQDVMKTAVAPQISGEWIIFDEDAFADLVDWDEAQSQVDLTPDVKDSFKVTGEVESASGMELEVELDNAWVEEGPTMTGSREDFIVLEATFEGPTFTRIDEVST